MNFNASDLLYEENVGGGDGRNVPLIDIVPPQSMGCNVGDERSDLDIASTGDLVQGTGNCGDQERLSNDTGSRTTVKRGELSEEVRTRSGRVVRTPKSYCE